MVSVIITTCNRSICMVQRAIQSVINQTYSDWELIVIDDTPPQYVEVRNQNKKSIESINDSRIQYIQNVSNRGACYSRNFGLSLARGEYIAFLDDDDEWLPEKLEEQLKVFAFVGPDVALIYCGGLKQDDSTGKLKEMNNEYIRGDVFYPLLAGNFIGSTSHPLLKAEVLRCVGGFDEKMPAAQDADLWLRIAKEYKVDYVKKPLFIYHIHKGDCITANVSKKIYAIQLLENKWGKELDSHPEIKYVRKMKMAGWYAQDRKLIQGIKIWAEAIKIQPAKLINNSKKLLSLIYKRLRVNNIYSPKHS